MLAIGHTQVSQEWPGKLQVAFLLAVMPGRRSLALLLSLAFEQRRLALLAELQLHLVGQRQKVRVLEGRRYQAGNDSHRFSKRKILGDVASLVAIHKAQARLFLDGQRLDDDPLQISLAAHVFGQDQLDQRVLRQAGLQQAEELREMIGRSDG